MNHRNKVTRHHVLLDKDNMPRKGKTFLPSLVELNIYERDAGSQTCVEEFTYIQDIEVKSAVDKENCCITGIAMVSRNELILADYDNKSVKLVDAENNIIKGSLKLEANPVGVTMISKDEVAVGLWNKFEIKIISVARDLSVLRTLNTDGKCVDIKYINGKLYVSFHDPVRFQILQPTGAVFKTIEPKPEVLERCSIPRYIAVTCDETMIYFSDPTSNKVLCIDTDGKMVAIFNGELDGPYGITISPTGLVYLCNRRQHIVYKMAPDLSEATVVLRRGDGLSFPIVMCCNSDKENVFISSGSSETKYCNFIKVYEWKLNGTM